MRVLQLLGLLLSPELAAATCRIYTRDAATRPPSEHSTLSQSLSPLAARLVLAQRAGVEEFHKLDLTKPEVISAINDFGIWTSLLEDATTQRNLFYVIDNVDNEDASISVPTHYQSFTVSAAPSVAAFQNLLGDLRSQEQALFHATNNAVRESIHDGGVNSTIEILHWSSPKFDIKTLHELDTERVTIIAFSAGHREEADEDIWGTYEMPQMGSQLTKRSRLPSEEPLETESVAFGTKGSLKTAAAPGNGTVKGILPSCFSTKAICNTETRGCSGRGECYLKYTDPDAKDVAPHKHCYTCKCKATTVERNGKTLTTYWGGPACQKKDISVQFWILALFTVGLVSLVSFAIGTIWSMGNEELPSVIGAGVSGPIKRS